MACTTCESILLQQWMASTRLHWETSRLVRLAGRNQLEFEATLRRCQQLREDWMNAQAALRNHRRGHQCTVAVLEPAGSHPAPA